MIKKGRKFELLIETLEKYSLNDQGKIISPGFLIDKVTNQSREVDILIKSKIGTTDISIIIECRDRKSKQDVTWIEQIYTKLNDLNADKVIAVSSSGFTKPALAKAKRYGIETRTYSEIDRTIIESWWRVEHIDFISKQFNIVYFHPTLVDNDILKKLKIRKDSTSKILYDSFNNKNVSFTDLFQGVCGQIKNFWGNLVPNGSSERVRFNVDWDDEERKIYLLTEKNESKLISIEYVVDLFIVCKKIPVSKVSSYSNSENTISHVIEYEKFPLQKNSTLRILKSEDGTTNLSIRSE